MKRAGFTLLEVMVATVIMGVAVTGLIVGLSNSVRNEARLTDYDRATMLARTRMADLLLDVNLPFTGEVNGLFAADETSGTPMGWRAATSVFEAPPNAGPGTVILQQIALEVWWQPTGSSRRTLTLESYRPMRIPNPSTP